MVQVRQSQCSGTCYYIEVCPSLYCVEASLGHTSYIHTVISAVHKYSSLHSIGTLHLLNSIDFALQDFLTPSRHIIQVLPLSLVPATTDSYTF